MDYIMSIDVGTQSVRVCLFNACGELIDSQSKGLNLITEKPGWASQRPEEWWEDVKCCIHKLINHNSLDTKKVICIAADGHMHAPVPITKDKSLSMDEVQLYSDKRTSAICNQLMAAGTGKQFQEVTGNVPGPQWMGLKIKWIKQNATEAYKKTRCFLTVKDFINFKLTGEMAIDPSEAAGTLLMDAATNQWSKKAADLLDIDIEKMPPIVNSTDIIGHVIKKAAEETGLNEGTPVVAGGGDMVCGMLGAGLTGCGYSVDITGTGSCVVIYSDGPIKDEKLLNVSHVIDGWISYCCLDSAGICYRWFRDNCAKAEMEHALQQNMDAYELLNGLIEKTNCGADGVIFLPYLLGERTMGSPFSKGVLLGLYPGTSTAVMARAVLEGVAFEHRRFLDVMKEKKPIEYVIHIGGAAKGDTWNQIKADIYNLPVYKINVDENTALGAAILGGVAVGIWKSGNEAADQFIKLDKEYTPNTSNRQLYEDLFGVYKESHDAMIGIFNSISKLYST